jgi:N-acetyl-gamma-glutamyl-phosphate reductase
VIRVGIVGGTGYGGREIVRLLALHPEAELAAVASTSAAGTALGDVLPGLAKTGDVVCQAFDAPALADQCDVVFVAAPSVEALAPVAALREVGVRVIDIGPDFRLKDPALYKKYYKADHSATTLLDEAVYGLVPHNREAIAEASLVAVPGCYPISVLMPLRPLLRAPLAEGAIVADSISGTSGAGKSLSEALHFSEMNENVWAYKVGVHQHVPEMEQHLENKMMIQFTPHVGPYTRGILSTLTIRLKGSFDVAQCYDAYEAEPFVRVLGEGNLPQVKHVRASNFCDFGWVYDDRTSNLVVVSAIDNLVGGTAGMAVQCMNLMFGIDETSGLLSGGMTP